MKCAKIRWKAFWGIVGEALYAINAGIVLVMCGTKAYDRLYGTGPAPAKPEPLWKDQDRIERACEVLAPPLPQKEPERTREIHRRSARVESILSGPTPHCQKCGCGYDEGTYDPECACRCHRLTLEPLDG